MTVLSLRRLVLAALLAAPLAATLAPGAARAAEDDDSIWNFDRKVFKEIRRGLGLRGAGDENIDYRERSPLVVPPSRKLPSPETIDPEKTAASWPVDADLKEKRAARAAAAVSEDPETWGNSLRPSQMRASGRRSASRSAAAPQSGDLNDPDRLTPAQLGVVGTVFDKIGSLGDGIGGTPKDEVAEFRQEPARQMLTDPPVGYQTPSSAFAYGKTKRVEYGPAMKIEDRLTAN